jgi:hypothetical protein
VVPAPWDLGHCPTESDPANPVSTIPRIPPLTGRIWPVADADDLASAYHCRRQVCSWDWRTPGTASGHPLSHQHLPQPLLGLLGGCNRPAALLLDLVPAVPLDCQFLPHPLESLFEKLLLDVHVLNHLIPGEPLMSQFGLEVVDRRLGLLEQMLCMLSCDDLRAQSLPCRCAGCVTLIPVDDRDRDLTIPNEAPTLWT